jgi:cystathionine beta-lyase
MSSDPTTPKTKVVTLGRNLADNYGIINPPVYHASTITFPDVARFRSHGQPYTYGRYGTPTTTAMQDALTGLEAGAAGCVLTSSGLSAISTAMLSLVSCGDHVLISDSVYSPTRNLCEGMLKRFGVEAEYYDPLIGSDITSILRPNTKVVFTESPGSHTFEIQDIPAIAEAAHTHGDVYVLMDNTWATGLFYQPFRHGVDVSIQAATKYIAGHSDVMMGAITANSRAIELVRAGHRLLGQCAAPDDIYLALRGLRTMELRLQQQMRAGIEIASWLQYRSEVSRVLHPALPSHPEHDLWKRDFTGASGLFSVILKPVSRDAHDNFLNSLKLFAMGYSWGGFESLVIPINPASHRTATKWQAEGPALRFHIGLESVDDLKADLAQGLAWLT